MRVAIAEILFCPLSFVLVCTFMFFFLPFRQLLFRPISSNQTFVARYLLISRYHRQVAGAHVYGGWAQRVPPVQLLRWRRDGDEHDFQGGSGGCQSVAGGEAAAVDAVDAVVSLFRSFVRQSRFVVAAGVLNHYRCASQVFPVRDCCCCCLWR